MAKLGWVDAPFLKRYRKWAFLGAFLVAAILTPTPDPFNQCLMAVPMYVFYEVGIIGAGIFGKKSKEQETSALLTVSKPVGTANGKGSVGVPSSATASGNEYVGVPQGGPVGR